MASRMYTDSDVIQASKDHQNVSGWYLAAAPSLLSLSASTSAPVAPPLQGISYTQESIVPLPFSSIRDSPIDSSASCATTISQRLALRSFPSTMSIETSSGHPSVFPFLMAQESSLRYSFVRGHATNEVSAPNIPSNTLPPPNVAALVRHVNSYPHHHDPSVQVHNIQSNHLPPLPYTANMGNVLLSDDCTTTSPQELTDHFDTSSGSSASTIDYPHWNNSSNAAAATTRGPVDERAVIIPVSPDMGSHSLPIHSDTNVISPTHNDDWRPRFPGQLYRNPSSHPAVPVPVTQWSQTASSSWGPSASFPVSMPVSTFDPLRAQLPNTMPSYMPQRRTTYPPQQPFAFIEDNNGQIDYQSSDPPGRTHGQRPNVGQTWSGHAGREGVEREVHASTSITNRSNRPPVAFRRRSSISAGVGTSLVVKRKPLPKIYGCETCGKKFDRPSTLKVHEAIHTGAKDHLCEYCIRAFTVQSNMKRHMRVCKHKPLSPPFTLCFFTYIAPAASFGLALLAASATSDTAGIASKFASSTTSTSAVTSCIDNSDDMASNQDAFVQHPPTSFNNRTAPVVETDDGPVTLLRFNSLQELPSHSQAATRAHPPLLTPSVGTQPAGMYASGGPQPNQTGQHGYDSPSLEPLRTIKGYKAPMIIAAMFSVQQNIPESISKLTLVQLDCEVPLRPVRPHEKYARLYTPHGIADEANVPGFRRSSSSTADRASFSVMQPSVNVAPRDLSTSTSSAEPTQGLAAQVEVKEEEERVIDEGAQIPNLKPLPPDLYEERNSWYPRSRYCYHPAEYDPGQVLPGPGVMDLTHDEEMIARQVYRTTGA